MTFLPLNLSIEARQNCCSFLSVVFFVMILVGLGYIFVGAFVQQSVMSFGSVDYERYSNAYPNFMIAVGILLIAVHMFGTKIVLMTADWRNTYLRPYRMQHVMLAFVSVLFLMPMILLVFCLVSFTQEARMRDAFYEGFIDGMRRYRTELDLKIGIDRTQMTYHCCGALSYEDWFQVSWVDVAFVDKFDGNVGKNVHNGEFFTESVPFSCCSVKALRPCISNFVHDRNRHYEYHPEKEMTIYQDSCADVTSRYMRKVVKRVGRFSICVLSVSVINLLIYRYVQTSLITAATWGDPTQIAAGYLALFGSKAPAPPDRPSNFEELAQREKELSAMAGAKPEEKPIKTEQEVEMEAGKVAEETGIKEEEEYEPMSGAAFNVTTNAMPGYHRLQQLNASNRHYSNAIQSNNWRQCYGTYSTVWRPDDNVGPRHDRRRLSRRRLTTDHDTSVSGRRSRERPSRSRKRSRHRSTSRHHQPRRNHAASRHHHRH